MMNEYLKNCRKIKEALVINYENINYEKLSNFLQIEVQKNNKFANRNKYFEKNKMKLLKFIANSKIIL